MLRRDWSSTCALPISGAVVVEGELIRPMAVELLATACYLVCAGLLLVPKFMPNTGAFSFSLSLISFLVYEFMVGIYMPCEGVIRSLYIPPDSRCSLMMFPRIIVNIAVSIGVISTNFVSLSSALCAVSCLMITSAVLQLSLVSSREWGVLFGRVDRWKRFAVRSFLARRFPSRQSTVMFTEASQHQLLFQAAIRMLTKERRFNESPQMEYFSFFRVVFCFNPVAVL